MQISGEMMMWFWILMHARFGFQVDISTMLEEAVHYIKFMQLQIKVGRNLWIFFQGCTFDFRRLITRLETAPVFWANWSWPFSVLCTAFELGWHVDVRADRLQRVQRRPRPQDRSTAAMISSGANEARATFSAVRMQFICAFVHNDSQVFRLFLLEFISVINYRRTAYIIQIERYLYHFTLICHRDESCFDGRQ